MIAKIILLTLIATASCQYPILGSGLYGAGLGAYGMPVYRSSANYGGLLAANGWGYGANLGRVAGLGALRTTGLGVLGTGAYGVGTGALVGGLSPALSAVGVGYAPALSTVGVAAPALSQVVAAPALGQVVSPALSTVGLAPGYAPAVSHLGLGLNINRGLAVHQAGPVNAAVHTIARTVDYRPVPHTGEPPVVQDIDVPPNESPLRINFQSKSSPLILTQQHIPAEPGQVQQTHSEDEPQTAIHQVIRPVIQQVNEVIQPIRTLTQSVEPVIEQTHTNIAQGEGVRLTGLQSGIVGGSGVLGASGVATAGHLVSPAVQAVAAPAVAAVPALGVSQAHLGLRAVGYRAIAGPQLGLRAVAAPHLGYRAIATPAYAGIRTLATPALATPAIAHHTGVVGARVIGGPAIRTWGLGAEGGLALNGLSGLSTLGRTGKVANIERIL